MDKHLRLLEMMPSEARPEGLGYTELGGWTSCGFPMDDHHAHAIIEHSGMVWLMGQATEQNTALSMTCHELNGSNYQIMYGCLWSVDGNTLIDALLAAGEHAREGGEGEK